LAPKQQVLRQDPDRSNVELQIPTPVYAFGLEAVEVIDGDETGNPPPGQRRRPLLRPSPEDIPFAGPQGPGLLVIAPAVERVEQELFPC
jgi:hypothetical protein